MHSNFALNPARYLIIDDEIQATCELQKLLSTFPSLQLMATVSDPGKAVVEIVKHRPDLIFLDIQMPGHNGFEIVEELQKSTVTPFIIFVTAFDNYAIRAIRASAFDFLLKPVDKIELALSVDRFLKRYREHAEKISYTYLLEQTYRKRIRFNTTGGFVMVRPEDILYVQADWNYAEIYYNRRSFEMVTLNLGTVEEILPHESFVRINRAVIINLKYLERVNRRKRICILKKDGEEIEFRIPLLRIRILESRL
jgi:two-component system, LytTR family, response regulator